MTDVAEAAREYVRRSRAEQGLPATVEDAVAIDRIVALIRPSGDAPSDVVSIRRPARPKKLAS